MSIIEKLGITKAPWRLGIDLESICTDYKEEGKNWNRLNCTKNGFAKCIAKIKNPKWMGKFESKANAQLIALAPEMLEALIDIAIDYRPYTVGNNKTALILKYNQIIGTIQKATNKSWEEIKELLDE